MSCVVRRFAVAAASLLLVACGGLAEPPPQAADEDPRSLRATDPGSAASDLESTAATTPPEPVAETDEEPEGEPPPEPPKIHPEQYVSRWLDHYLPRADDEEWRVTEPAGYEWDLAGRAHRVEPVGAFRADLDAYVSEVRSLPAADRPIDVGYVALEFSGGFEGVLFHYTSGYDGEAVRILELAGVVLGFVEDMHNGHVEDVEMVSGVHVFHVTEGAGGMEARIWRHGPTTVMLTGPYGVGMEDIARATIESNS